jgi:hypothetical protein
MTKQAKQKNGGPGATIFLFFLAAAGVALALDYSSVGTPGFWIGASSGGAAALGAAAAVFCVIAAHVARLVLVRGAPTKGDGDVRPSA